MGAPTLVIKVEECRLRGMARSVLNGELERRDKLDGQLDLIFLKRIARHYKTNCIRNSTETETNSAKVRK